jgi:nascent polypeptide-associated complex subunit alpha
MMPGMNPRQMNKMMQKMGIKQDEIEASEVIIKTPGKNLIIKNPSVTRVDMMGQKTFQIIGTVTEESPISEEDIATVSEQANVSKEKAKEELEKTSGDLAEAIVNLTE